MRLQIRFLQNLQPWDSVTEEFTVKIPLLMSTIRMVVYQIIFRL